METSLLNDGKKLKNRFVPSTVHIYEKHGKVIIETYVGGGLKMKSTTKNFDGIHRVVVDAYKKGDHISTTEYTFDEIESAYYSAFSMRLYQYFSIKEIRCEGEFNDDLIVTIEVL